MDYRQRRDRGEQTQELVNSVLDDVFVGKQAIISHEGVSQYHERRTPSAGRSACGLAALNCARLVFAKEDAGLTGEELIRWLLSRQGAEEITSICDYWTKASHLEMEDILDIPIFSENVSLVGAIYSSQCELASFKALLQDLSNASKTSSSAVMITKPPEIVACMNIPTSRGDVLLVFDSHIRPNHPLGAGFILNSNVDSAAAYLAKLFRFEKSSLSGAGNPFQWQMELMQQFCGHILVSKRNNGDAAHFTRTLLESSMKILALTAELANLKSENSILTVELQKTNERLIDMQAYYRKDEVSKSKGTDGRPNFAKDWRRNKPVSTAHAAASSSARTLDIRHPESDHTTALQLQEEFAIEEQLRYVEEDVRLSAERITISRTQQSLFKCGVCLEELPEDNMARLPQCRHSFCRDCIKEYVRSKLNDHRFPMICPICVVEQTTPEPSVLEDSLIRQIGITEDEYKVFEELQMSTFSVLLHCARCRHSMFVDRQEHQEAKILVCPLPGCQYTWCKTCQQQVDTWSSGPQHSCDGSLELQDLMSRRGWKACPGCQTPIQKESGCNHITCMSPGCNTHFCYKCGDLIVRSALRREIRASTSRHYRRCTLFEGYN